jgi:succinate dehydrogenase / fumarate reductase cytochrome b subunit
MSEANRPLSPHLQVYRFQITMAMSILHRLTGVGLGVGTVLLAWWLIAAAVGPNAYASFEWFIDSWVGLLALLGFTFSLFYHLFNGIRHLFWDAGMGFELPVMRASGLTVAIISVLLTVIAWIVGFAVRSG